MIHAKRRLAPALVLPILLNLFAAPAGAAPLERTASGLFARAWSLLSSIWADAGCMLDPNGACRAPSTPIIAGCMIDPDGACRAPSAPVPILRDGGCILDPNGGCQQ